jgi:hypothetical protein
MMQSYMMRDNHEKLGDVGYQLHIEMLFYTDPG